MMLKKFVGPTTRDALKKLREELGEDAVILSTKQTAAGTEVLAALPEASDITTSHATPSVAAPAQPFSWTRAQREEHARQQEAQARPAERDTSPRQFGVRQAPLQPTPERDAPVRQAAVRDIRAVSSPPYSPEQPTTNALAMPSEVLGEIKEMRQLLKDQMAMLTWKDSVERNPLRSQLWREMTDAGFSPVFARTVVEKLPEDLQDDSAHRWLNDVMLRNLSVFKSDDDIVDRGGIYALVGPTGVGKTTTTAKMAARCVVKYGAQSVGLITTDSYRIGAQDQLRIYGKILGVQVYTAQTEGDLQQLLASMAHKHLVLIDTVGMGQRDSRVSEQTDMLASSKVNRILLLNAAAQAETLDDVARHYRGSGLHGAIITKLDEAVKLGGVLDVAMRHRLGLHYMATGQRVPEDLFPAEPNLLLKRALRPSGSSTFGTSDQELQWKMAHMPSADPTTLR